jgi:hypothetical protein
MKSVNSLSGGKTSGYIAVHYPADHEVFSVVCLDDIRCKVKDPAVLLYAQAKLEKFNDRYGQFIATAEDDMTLKAMMDLEQYIGREIIWVRGKSFDSVLLDGTYTRLPSWARRYCTEQMKLAAIFEWWFYEIGEKCEMRIGFRFDEFDRMIRFFNNSNPTNFKIPVACSTRGKRLQRHENFNWRSVTMPLIKAGVTKQIVDSYWRENGWIGGDLFESRRQIIWPAISNCVFCFHKKVETLAAGAIINPEKMNWAAEAEKIIKNGKSMGKWLDSLIPYDDIIANAGELSKEIFIEMKHGQSCDSGGCTD